MNINEVKDFVTVVASLFSIALAIKTLFSSKKNHTISNNGNNNVSIIDNRQLNTTVTNTSNKVKNTTTHKTYTKSDDSFAMFLGSILLIVSILVILTANFYVVSILAVLNAISLLINLNRCKQINISFKEVAFTMVEHILFTLVIFSGLFIPDQLKTVAAELNPINFQGFSFLMDWFKHSLTVLWNNLAAGGFKTGNFLIITRVFGFLILFFHVLSSFSKRIFLNKIKKIRQNDKKLVCFSLVEIAFSLILLHFQFIFYPIILPIWLPIKEFFQR